MNRPRSSVSCLISVMFVGPMSLFDLNARISIIGAEAHYHTGDVSRQMPCSPSLVVWAYVLRYHFYLLIFVQCRIEK